MGKDIGQGKFFPKYFDKKVACYLNSLCICVLLIPQSCPTLCNFMDYSLSDSSIHGIFQARILEWVAFPLPGNRPNPGAEPESPAFQAGSLPSETPVKLFLKISKYYF